MNRFLYSLLFYQYNVMRCALIIFQALVQKILLQTWQVAPCSKPKFKASFKNKEQKEEDNKKKCVGT